MVAYGHLLGHREADRVRYTHYSQGMPYAPSGTCVPQVGEWASFAELSKHWPCGIAVDAGEGARVIHGRAMSARVNGATTVVETAPTWDVEPRSKLSEEERAAGRIKRLRERLRSLGVRDYAGLDEAALHELVRAHGGKSRPRNTVRPAPYLAPELVSFAKGDA
jgi:hypothetical protein